MREAWILPFIRTKLMSESEKLRSHCLAYLSKMTDRHLHHDATFISMMKMHW